jgi:hypothetical protein
MRSTFGQSTCAVRGRQLRGDRAGERPGANEASDPSTMMRVAMNDENVPHAPPSYGRAIIQAQRAVERSPIIDDGRLVWPKLWTRSGRRRRLALWTRPSGAS